MESPAIRHRLERLEHGWSWAVSVEVRVEVDVRFWTGNYVSAQYSNIQFLYSPGWLWSRRWKLPKRAYETPIFFWSYRINYLIHNNLYIKFITTYSISSIPRVLLDYLVSKALTYFLEQKILIQTNLLNYYIFYNARPNLFLLKFYFYFISFICYHPKCISIRYFCYFACGLGYNWKGNK